EHTIFHSPYEVGDSLRPYRTFWEGDLGDLLRASARSSQDGNPGQFLAGTMPSEKDNHAALLACYDGRVILQTFSSHEYAYNKITPLWKNYIYHTLKNRFAPAFAETAGSEHLAAPPPAPPAEVAACGPALVGRILQTPEYVVDLFEHHAVGEYLIIEVEITNHAGAPIQFWDDDYWVEAGVAGGTQRFNPAKEATTYLYNTRSGNWLQERMEPDQSLRMFLAFDMQPQAAGPTLVIQPGVELGRPLCELRLELEE
ncbi:MAG TPA: hypothetical protein VLS48_08660, partial [Anaerolineales bacterium]|nr:hypothetical protein [Anaerolineales bacterium]